MSKKNKYLKIKGMLLDNNQLFNSMEKSASSNEIVEKSKKSTFPIPRLKENFKFITKTYILLNNQVKLKMDIHPAGEWILDNFYIIEETYKRLLQEMPIKKYKNLPGIEEGENKDFARIYVVASEIVEYTDGKLNDEILEEAINAYQTKKLLSMEEIWNLYTFLAIAIIENIRNICEKIYYSQIQKYKAENIIDRLINKKTLQNLSGKNKEKNIYSMKNAFVEYMSFKLKKMGKVAIPYLEVLENIVDKSGTSISDVIKKEHYNIAFLKVAIGNNIISLKEISRIDFISLFEKINGVEEILKKDPAKVYEKMDYKTKEYYRNAIKSISQKHKISELYIAKILLKVCEKKETDKEKHVGNYLIGEGKNELLKNLGIKTKKNKSTNFKSRLYILILYLVTSILTLPISAIVFLISKNIYISILAFIILYIPISEIEIQAINNIIAKKTKPKLIPKLDFNDGVPEECSTFVVIPTILSSREKVKELMEKLEVYYLANKSKNIYFALLGDCTSSKNKYENFDQEIIEEGKEQCKILNEKYVKDLNSNIPRFNFLYRERTWNNSEECYLGWERKRGLLYQFNEFLLEGKNTFLENTIENSLNLNQIKFIITLDSDTNLTLNSGIQLIGAMAHVLNKPVIDNNIVVKGHGIIQPRIGINLDDSRKSIFSRIYSGVGGTDSYTNVITDIYQDSFEEGIFIGKGIYDLKVFHTIFKDEILENTVLSHDLLEGCYLRCGVATDILLLDGTPYKYNSFCMRESRWIRGDWQILSWLGKKVRTKKGVKQNPLNKLSKFKIVDNLRRSLLPVMVFIGLIFSLYLKIYTKISGWKIAVVCIIAYIYPSILDVANYIIFKKGNDRRFIYAYKNLVPIISPIKASIIKGLLEILFLPHKTYLSIAAISKTIYRIRVSKKHLLEWTTAEEAEKNAKTTLISFYNYMKINVIIGTLSIIIGIVLKSILSMVLGALWCIAPIVAMKISKEIKTKNAKVKVKKSDLKYLENLGKKIWNFFEDNVNEENNFLPPDNYQEDRKNKIAKRTSPTNIGLGMLSIVSAYDLKYITLDKCLKLLEKMVNTIEKLDKWNGHLYNWYNTKTLTPLIPMYVSTVDNGNFIGYLYTIKQFLNECNNEKANEIVYKINYLIENTNFKYLYNNKKNLFSIGFDIEQNKLTNSYYDLLASEARQASLIAIAKKDIPEKHWGSLSRTLTSLNKYKGLISWSGTAFEYLMPNINIKNYEASLLDESCRFLIMSQIEYSKKIGIPWGVSESAFSLKDLNNNYQYKAFGIPWLALKRGMEDEMVIAPYSVLLSLNYVPNEAINNLKKLESEMAKGKYGFYEAIDYTRTRLKYGKKNEVVKTYMAHHQGLSLLSINNFINNNVLVKRFMKNPEIQAVDILLQERMPDKAIITKERKEKIEKIKGKNYENYIEDYYTEIDENLNVTNTISNGLYTVCTKQNGEGFSKFGDVLINRFKQTSDYKQGIFFYIKDIDSKRIWCNNQIDENNRGDKFKIVFAPDKNEFIRMDGDIETKTKNIVCPEEPVEIRRIELKNSGMKEKILEITNYFEPVLSHEMQDYAHMAFNNLFLTFEKIEEDSLIVERKKRQNDQNNIYLGVSFFTEDDTIGDLEYEIDKEKFWGKKNVIIPQMVKESKPYSKNVGLVTASCLATKRIIKLMPKETKIIDLILVVGNNKKEVVEKLKEYKNKKKIENNFELAKAKVEAESIYLGIKGKDIKKYQKLISYILFNNPLKKETLKNLPKKIYSQSKLWKFGISGDLPILLLKISDLNDIHIVKDTLKAHEFFRSKNIKVDLVILDEEIYSYDRLVENEIENVISNMQMEFLKNISGGIFVICTNQINSEDKDLIEFRANVVLRAKNGDIETELKDLEKEYVKNLSQIGLDKKINLLSTNEEENIIDKKINLEYDNEYGGFDPETFEYKIRIEGEKNLPTVWSMILANKTFGTIITNNLGGFTWHKNSRLNRLSAWSNDPIMDIPSEIIYIKDCNTDEKWSLSNNLNKNSVPTYLTYGFGFVKYSNVKNNIAQELEIFVPEKDNVKINILKLKNLKPEKRDLKIFYYIKPVLGEDEIKTNGYIDVRKDNNVILIKNLYKDSFKKNIAFVSSSEKIVSYTGSKDFFIGRGNLISPEAIDKVSLNNSGGIGENSCIAIELNIELESFENKEIILQFGEEEKEIDVKNLAYKYSKINTAIEEFKNVKKFWENLIEKIQVKTPLESLNIMLNGWAEYQTIVSRLWSKTGYYQSGGAVGFRDQLQDTIGLKNIDINFMREQILLSAKHQFIEGDVEHWWHEDTNRGIRTRFSDDLLWLCYVTAEYISYSGDKKILDEQVPYVVGELLPEKTDERYDVYLESKVKEDIYTHCIRAIDRSLNFGEHGLPKIGSGDWNDGMNMVGNKQKGESVWLRFFSI